MCDQGIHIFEETQKSLGDISGNADCPGSFCSKQNCRFVHTWRENVENCYQCLQSRASSHVCIIFSRIKNQKIKLFGGDGTYCIVKRTSTDYENEKPSPFWKCFLFQSQLVTPKLVPKKEKLLQSFHLRPNGVNFPLPDTSNQKLMSSIVLCIFSLQ